MKLQDVLSNANYDFSRKIIGLIQNVHSHDIGIMQLADILIGAVSYHARGLNTSEAKKEIVDLIKNKTQLSLERNTLPGERKFNLCIWKPDSRGFENA